MSINLQLYCQSLFADTPLMNLALKMERNQRRILIWIFLLLGNSIPYQYGDVHAFLGLFSNGRHWWMFDQYKLSEHSQQKDWSIDKAGSQVDSCFTFLVARQHCVAKICNTRTQQRTHINCKMTRSLYQVTYWVRV